MAEQSVHDVVNQEQSVGDLSPSDASANQTNYKVTAGEGDEDQFSVREENGSQPQSSEVLAESTAHELENGVFTNGASLSGTITGQPYPSSAIDVSQPPSEDLQNPADGSGHGDNASVSDTDGSRAEGSAAEDGRGQDLPAALKKSATFKPVTFTKSKFPVSRGATTAVGTKSVGEKATASATNASAASVALGSRPRLVAKSASGLGTSAKSSKPDGKNGAIPDPMQVWNKNRVTPQPSTKHLTDEELKQQYGIHLTSRIQGDGDGKESKWADIDDEEDDWAPETIEWGDGTKVTLNHPEAVPPTAPGSKIELPSDETGKPVQPMKIMSPLTTTTIGPNATVLRLGASAERQQAQKAAILQKGPSERPTQASTKASAPPPSKSPWASLPPVERVSPVVINPQMQMPPPLRYPNNQGTTQSPSGMTTQSPAQEISADDFNRSWRDTQISQTSQAPRELYMPNSGKYEAVNESRRRGSRNDQNFRAPALLQRPSQSDQHAPAEPSAAFQTHRSNAEQERAPWTRRRASSNLSGTSGQYARRMSINKTGDMLAMQNDVFDERRGSHATGTDSVVSSQDTQPPPPPTGAYKAGGFSPSQGMPRKPSSSNDQAKVETAPSPAAPQDLEADRAIQKQLMREKRELAIKRRQEEEERLEAEKRERIRLKLESLGPPPEKVKIQEPLVARVETTAPAVESTAVPRSPPKPPIPEAGVTTQYGMMKLHPPDMSRKAPSFDQPATTPATGPSVSEDAHKVAEPLIEAGKPSPVLTNGLRPVTDLHSDNLPKESSNDKPVQSLKGTNTGSETRSAWPTSSTRLDHRSPPTANLWGVQSSNKALGNGTFDKSLASFPPRDFGAREPGWTNGRTVADKSPQLVPAINQLPQDRVTPVPPFPQSPLAAGSEVDSVQPQSRPAPIGPPQQNSQRWQASPNMRPATSGVAAWNDFQNVAAREDRAENERIQRDLALRLEEEARTGLRKAPQYTFNETWKQVEIGDQAGQRQVTGVAQSAFNPAVGNQFGAVGSAPGAELASRNVIGLPVRGSRFFPHIADGVSTQNKRAVTYSHTEVARSPSPPLAEEYGSGHPAFDGDLQRPVVQLPPQKPVVKLPPRPSPTVTPALILPPRLPPQAAPRSFAAALMKQPSPPPTPPPQSQPSLRTVSQPIATTSSWQDRFNGLLGKQPTQPAKSPEKKHHQVLPVTSSSRELFDSLAANIPASVSLPQIEESVAEDDGRTTSKDVEDENDIFEDREPGSQPTVKMPLEGPKSMNVSARTPNNRFRGRAVLPLDEPFTVAPFVLDFPGDHGAENRKADAITIHVPGMATAVKKDLPSKISSSTSSRSRTSRNSSSTFTKPKRGGVKSREVSATHSQASQGSKSSQSQASLPNGAAPSPRPAQSHNSRWHRHHQAAPTGMAH